MSTYSSSPGATEACQAPARYVWRYLMTPAMFRESVERIDVIDAGAAASKPSFEIWYQTALGAGSVRVIGGRVNDADWEPLVARRRIVLITMLSCVLCAVATRSDYTGRGTWFADYGATQEVFALACAAGLFATVASIGWTLPQRARSSWRTRVPTTLSALSLLACLIRKPLTGSSILAGSGRVRTRGT